MSIRIFLLPLLLLLSFSGYSQKKHYKVISLNVIPWFDSYSTVLQPTFEYSLNKSLSLGLSIEKGKFNIGEYNGVQVSDLKGWGIMPQFRYYPFTQRKPAPFGFFIGTHFRYRILEESYYSNVNVSTRGYSFDLGACLGYKIKADILNFEFLFGSGWGNGSFKTPNQRDLIDPILKSNLSSAEYYLRMEINVGIHFPQFRNEAKSSND